MPFLPSERKAPLAVKGVGPTVVARLEQMGCASSAHLSKANALDIASKASSIVGSTFWKNSPQARAAIQSAIALSQSHQAQMSNPHVKR
nr:helix-hairpin-helix domain-containing protein [Rhodoferax sp.]